MDSAKVASFRNAVVEASATHTFSSQGAVTSGWGMDPDRQGPDGLLVFVSCNDLSERNSVMEAMKNKLPASWEGVPVYFKGTPYYGPV